MMCKFFFFSFSLFFFSASFAQNTNISGVVNVYRKVIAADSAKGYVRLADASNFTQYIGKKVMIIQMKGAVIDSSVNGSTFGDILTMNSAGKFEFGSICGQIADTIVLENKLQNFYDPAALVQLIIVPKYVNVTIVDTLKAKSWDPTSGTGGIIAIEASGTLFLNSIIYGDSSGFRGGGLINNSSSCSNLFTSNLNYYPVASGLFGQNGAKKGEGIAEYLMNKEYGRGKQANGGGGGNNPNHGGGGGGNAGAGGQGGNQTNGSCSLSNFPGFGGTNLNTQGYSNANLRIFLGGGGGAGHENNSVGTPGGNGGGIVYIKASSIVGGGNKITANGGVPYNAANTPFSYAADSDGGGGAGAGGVVILHIPSSLSFSGILNVEAKGGNGSDTEFSGTSFCAGPGGGGGGGIIWFSSPTYPGNVNSNITGGLAGKELTTCAFSNNGAAAGTAGLIKTSFALPVLKDSSPVCKTILPLYSQVDLTGYLSGDKIIFNSLISTTSPVSVIRLQRSFDGIAFSDISSAFAGSSLYSFEDIHQARNCWYRVIVISTDGRKQYSRILLFRGKDEELSLEIFPQPVIGDLILNFSSAKMGSYPYQLVDVAGRKLKEGVIEVSGGDARYSIPVGSLSGGLYFLKLSCSAKCYPFLKK